MSLFSTYYAIRTTNMENFFHASTLNEKSNSAKHPQGTLRQNAVNKEDGRLLLN